jgi:hypothetical protein
MADEPTWIQIGLCLPFYNRYVFFFFGRSAVKVWPWYAKHECADSRSTLASLCMYDGAALQLGE